MVTTSIRFVCILRCLLYSITNELRSWTRLTVPRAIEFKRDSQPDLTYVAPIARSQNEESLQRWRDHRPIGLFPAVWQLPYTSDWDAA